MKETAINTTPF